MLVPPVDSQRRDFSGTIVTRRQEKRPAGITPPAFSCNCRLGRSGSAAIPCLKFDLYSINKILTIGCEVHHGWAEPSGASFVPIRVAALTGGQHDASLFSLLELRIDRSGEAVSDLAEARDRAAGIVRSLIMGRDAEDWRDWVVHVSDDFDDEIFVLPFAFVLGKPH